MSLEVLSLEERALRALRETRKGIDQERKNILLLSVAEDRPLTKEEVDKIFKLNKEHRITMLKIIENVIIKGINAF